MQPIWKDYTFIIDVTEAEYRVRLNDASGAIIYNGKAYARPGESSIRIKINDVAADYIRQSLPVIGKTFDESAFTMTFLVQYNYGGSWLTAGSIEYAWDWSHDYTYLASRDGYSFPVKRSIDARQYLPVTISGSTISVTLNKADGTTQAVTLSKKSPADFEDDADEDIAIFEQTPDGAAILDLSNYSNVVSVTISGKVFPVVSCHNFVLYYVNEYGGWDSLLLEGRCNRTDTYYRHSAKYGYDNADMRARGEATYANEITQGWSLRTGLLTDEGAERMHHLVGSTMVYLHDLAEGTIYPIIIDDTECEYRNTRAENGVVSYALQAHIAQEKVRR